MVVVADMDTGTDCPSFSLLEVLAGAAAVLSAMALEGAAIAARCCCCCLSTAADEEAAGVGNGIERESVGRAPPGKAVI